MRSRTLLNYAARIALVLAVFWLARNVYRALVLTLAVEAARVGPIDLATNLTLIAPVWLTCVVANVVIAARLRADVRRPFIQALIAIAVLPVGLLVGSIPLMRIAPKLGFTVLMTTGGAAFPLQAILMAAGVMWLSAPRD
jgi:hypothetical protein